MVVPPGKALGCLEGGPCCCRCSTGSSTIGLLDVVELRWFVRVQVLHGVLVSNLGLLSSHFREIPANPSHATELVIHFARPQAVISVLTHCLLGSVFFRKEGTAAPYLPSLCTSEDPTRKDRTPKGCLLSSPLPSRISAL